VVRALAAIDARASVLDAGCGHGLAALQLAQTGHRGPYLGVDSSAPLIDLARQRVRAPWAEFHVADLVVPGWQGDIPANAKPPFDWALAFALLHHLPGDGMRSQIVGDLRALLKAEGRAAVSVWDFLHSDRIRRRVISWASIGWDEADVDPGDTLLDWRHESQGLRYVHHFTSDDLADLVQALLHFAEFLVELLAGAGLRERPGNRHGRNELRREPHTQGRDPDHDRELGRRRARRDRAASVRVAPPQAACR